MQSLQEVLVAVFFLVLVPLLASAAVMIYLGFLFALLPSRIHRAPGWRLRAVAAVVFSSKVYKTVLEPILSDLEIEHCEALAQGRPGKARWVVLRGWGAFWIAVAAQLPVSLARQVFELWKASKTG